MIFAAHDTERDSEVAVKVLHRQSTAELFYLKHEFRVLASIEHPNLVRLYDLFVHGATGWFSMELVAGVDFVAAHADARNDGSEALLRRFTDLAPGLVDGVRTVHEAGFLHGDLKPANVLVEASDRVVLLDFGMATDLSHDDRLTDTTGISGTLAYLPPEALEDPRPSVAWDIYALGLLFVEAILGTSPYSAVFAQSLPEKRAGLPRSARDRLARVSSELADCLGAMLAPSANNRPALADVANKLLALSPTQRAPWRDGVAHELVGREDALVALRRWCEHQAYTTCVLRGSSGVGKTSLARTLIRELRARGELVLVARCHPRESVPFNGIDSILDDLVRLISRDDPEVDETLLRHLAVVFPVFSQLAEPLGSAPPGSDAVERLARAREALRVLIAAIARRHRLLLWIDDTQWADNETLGVLNSWADASEPPCTRVLLTSRADLPRTMRRELELELSALAPDDATALVHRLAPCLPEEAVKALYAETAGNPYILQRLARRSADNIGGPVPTLMGTIADVLAELPEDGAAAALFMALAGRPLELDLLSAAGVRGWVTLELERRGIATRSVDARHRFELQHDRLAAALLANTPKASHVRGHASLASTLIARGQADDTPHIATHLHASEHPEAAHWAGRAGERLAAAYALESAADWHRRAFEWTVPGDHARAHRRRALANALAAAGRAEEAGDTYVACSQEASEAAASTYLQQAAEHYLGAGITIKGMSVLRPLLVSRRIAWPASPTSAAAGILLRLARLAVPNWRRADPGHGLDLDLCWAAAKGLLGTDAVRGAYYALEGLERARRGTDQRRHARHRVAVAAIVLAPLGGPLAALGRRWIEHGSATAAAAQDPYLAGFALVCKGQLAVIEGRWTEARTALQSGVEQLQGDGINAHWEQHIGLMGLLRALQELREFSAMGDEAIRLRIRAEGLGDLYAEVTGRLYEGLAQLAARESGAARSHVARALARWGVRETLDIQQLYAEHILAVCDVVDEDARGAWQRVVRSWPRWERSQLLRIPVARIDCLALRARVALCAASDAGSERERLLASCRADARRLRREARPDARLLGEQIAAQATAGITDIGAIFPTHLAPGSGENGTGV